MDPCILPGQITILIWLFLQRQRVMNLLELVNEHWAWSGIDPDELVVSNDFGNLIIKDSDDKFWRLCPEDVYCSIVAESIEAYNELIQDEGFAEDWHMVGMLVDAKEALGDLAEGERYCLKVPGVLGGDYAGSNVIKAPLENIIKSAGKLGQHIADKPEGAKIDLKEIGYLEVG